MSRMRWIIAVVLLAWFTAGVALPAGAQTLTFHYRIYWQDGEMKVELLEGPSGTVEVQERDKPAIDSRALRYGSYGQQVAELEQKLKDLGYNPGVVDRLFTYQTQAAVMALQKDNHLQVTGVADAATLEALERAYAARPPESQPESDQLAADEARMLALINQERAKKGLPALEVEPRLVETARLKSRDMIEAGYFGHNSPTYGSPFAMMRTAGVQYRYAGENLAGASTVERAHQALMASPGHRANILNPRFTHVGIGIVDGGPYGKMFTQHFVGY